MAYQEKRDRLRLAVGGVLLSTLPIQGLSAEALKPENAISEVPSRCYWLDPGIPDEGLCGDKMRPDVLRMKVEAEGGNAFAAMRLGQLYSSGNWGVPNDDEQARYWYGLAAKAGNRAAQLRLGQAYEFGRMGVTRDIQRAIRYYEMAAEPGLYPSLEDRLLRLREERLGAE